MTIPISRGRLGIAFLFPVVGIRVGGLFITDSSSQRLLGFEVPELAIVVGGWLLVVAGLTGIVLLLPQLIDPKVGLTWDEESVSVRAGVGPKRRAKWEQVQEVLPPRGLIQSIRIDVADRPDLMVPVWLLELPEGWDAATLAQKLTR